MKKLTIEQKAKAYDEALKVLHKYDGANIMFTQDLKEEMFPELKESEDERIRKWLIYYFKEVCDNVSEKEKKGVLTWLEKQGEKIDVIENFDTEFEKQVSHLIASIINKEHEYNQGYVKWTANALLNYAKHELKKQDEQKSAEWSIDNLPEFESYLCLMFQKFRTKGICTNGEIIDFVKEHSQKLKDTLCHVWSEEDEQNYDTLLKIICGSNKSESLVNELFDWFKSLKNRVQLKNLIVTDEELTQAKKDAYNNALDKIEYYSAEPTFDDGWNAAIWYLKKKNIQPCYTWKPTEEQIGVIEAVMNNRSFQRLYLNSLYEQLKKLREK